MKVVYDHQIFSIQKYGGISRYFCELLKALNATKAADMELTVVCPFYRNAYLNEIQETVSIYGKKIPDVRYTRKLVSSLNQALSQSIFNGIDADVVHETYYSSRIQGSSSAKRIVTVYDMIHEKFPNNFSKTDRTTEDKKSAIGRADEIISISNNTKKDLIDIFGVDPNKIKVVHLGFSRMNDHSEDNIPISSPYILYVGGRGGYKNFSSLLESYSKIYRINKDFKLIAFGGGRFTSAERSFIKTNGLIDRVLWVEGSDFSLSIYYKYASLFVYPSLYEGFGIPPLEAMSNGCVVAASATSSIPEVVGDAAILFDPSSVDSIGIALERALFDSSLRKEKILRGYERIKYFSWDKCASETNRIYRGTQICVR